jgi:hypothetical protein
MFQGDLFGNSSDWSDLAPDRPAWQCQGRAVTVKGPHGEVEVYRPCGNYLPDLCFIPERALRRHSARTRPVRARCARCEFNIRAARKRLWRYRMRAKNALAKHMLRERAAGLHVCRRLADYEVLTGVTVDWLADRMERSAVHDEACERCRKRWSTMDGSWVMQMTVDRPDTKRTLSRDNLLLKCLGCNTSEKDTDARTRNVRDAMWRRWEAQPI